MLQLLAAACVRHGIKTLLAAHTLDDAVETLLMRVGRQAGLDGLGGETAHGTIGAVSLSRLLSLSRALCFCLCLALSLALSVSLPLSLCLSLALALAAQTQTHT
jgi:hypothetical protein